MRVRRHVLLSGLVQGVGFRQATRRQAKRRALSGWVRNLGDGRVEAVLEGDEAAIESMLTWCAAGPPGSAVDSVEVAVEEPEGLAGFVVLPSAPGA